MIVTLIIQSEIKDSLLIIKSKKVIKFIFENLIYLILNGEYLI
jgi:hypothetical protein